MSVVLSFFSLKCAFHSIASILLFFSTAHFHLFVLLSLEPPVMAGQLMHFMHETTVSYRGSACMLRAAGNLEEKKLKTKKFEIPISIFNGYSGACICPIG